MMQRGMMLSTRYKKAALQLAAVATVMLFANGAMAQTVRGLGGVMNNTTSALERMPNILSMVAYLSGVIFCVGAIFKLQHYVDAVGKPGPPPPPLSDAVKRFIAGGAMLSLPYMATITYNSVFGNGDKAVATAALRGDVSGNGLDALVVRTMTNIGDPIQTLLSAFCYLFAVGFLMVGITRLTKRAEDGPRGPAGMGTIMTFITSSALFAFGDMMGAFSNSLFNNGGRIATGVDLSALGGISTDDAAKIETVIQAVMAFIMIVGFIAFIRGWFVLRAFADGNQGATMAQGLTFLFGGALAINLGPLINAVQETVGITGITFS